MPLTDFCSLRDIQVCHSEFSKWRLISVGAGWPFSTADGKQYASLHLWWLIFFFKFVYSFLCIHFTNRNETLAECLCFYSNIDCGVTMDKKL